MTVINEVCEIQVKIDDRSPLVDYSDLEKASADLRKMDFEKMVNRLRDVFKSGKTLSYGYRIEQLKNLQRMVQENVQEIYHVLYKDLRKPLMEASGELLAFESELVEAMRCLKEWMTPEQLPKNLLLPNDRAFIKSEPFGVVLIISAWNYPFSLLLQPLVGAIAAGNCAVLKPSEIAPYTAAKIAELIPKYLDQKCFQVVEGGVPETTELLRQRFDFIFSTSSTRVGKSVMLAAATNLTPVCLELGGKSPVYIHDSADLNLSVKRILWGKMTNVGQTCIAPDYIICSKKVQDYFVEHSAKILEEWYGPKLKASGDIGRIINRNHFNRLSRLLNETTGKIALGGDLDPNDLWISPTLVVNVSDEDSLMNEEIFGPILPFIIAETALDALNYLNDKRAKPLALYLFSQDKSVNKLFLERTSSGGLSINDVILHCGWSGLPFGGVQDSGIGNYHGKYSFDCFSHRKGVLARDFSFFTEKLSAIRYPPYDNVEKKIVLIRHTLVRNLHLFSLTCSSGLSHLFVFGLGLLVMFLCHYFMTNSFKIKM